MQNKQYIMSRKAKRLWFYIIFSALPIAQVAVFYFYVNFRSFALAFQNYDALTDVYSFTGLSNFVQALSDLSTVTYLKKAISNSFLLFLVTLVFGSFPSILFSYYIFKKRIMSGFFKIILYLPHIISTVVFALMYKYLMEDCIPDVIELITGVKTPGLLYDVANMDRIRVLVMGFTVWIGFGTSVLMYSGTMSSISDSVIESGKLEGITPMKELFFIVIPLIWPTFVTFIIASFTGVFTNQMNLYTIFGETAEYELYTFGYFLYKNTLVAGNGDYPYLSAIGLLMTLVAVPVTLIVRYLLNKFGPKTE